MSLILTGVAYKMTTTIVPVRIADSWVNMTGCLDSPRYVFIIDKIGKDVVTNLATVGVDSRDAVVEVSRGDFQALDLFIHTKAQEFAMATAVVVLWYGLEELVAEAPPPGSCAPVIEEWFLEEGPRIIPRCTVAEVVQKYTSTIHTCLSLFPNSSIVSSDPPPRRSTGFAMSRAEYVASSIEQQDGRHHHIRFNRHFHGKRKSGNFNNGGKYPIHESLFVDGVVPKLDSWAAIFRRAYAALSSFSGAAVDHDSAASLRLVKIAF